VGVIGGKCAGRNCDSPLDCAGHHATTCPKGGDLYRWHNGLRDLIGRLLSDGGAAWAKEQGPSTDRTRPADILVPVWEQGSAVALDVTVVSPLNLDVVRQAGLTSGLEVGAPAAAAAALKHAAGDAACRELQWNLRALVANEYGGWGAEAEKFFRVLAERTGRRSGVTTSVARHALYAKLGVLIARCTGRVLLRRAACGGAGIGLAACALAVGD
jgi:hypothetical protein